MKRNAELLLEAERLFLPQKSKCTYLKQGDRYTNFFHDLIKRNNKRKAIVAVKKLDRTMTTDTGEIVEEFVQLYQNILGSKLDKHIIDGSIITDGPCIYVDDFEGLTTMVTMNEVIDALFDISNGKSQGSDGFGSLFFKSSGILFMKMSLQLCMSSLTVGDN